MTTRHVLSQYFCDDVRDIIEKYHSHDYVITINSHNHEEECCCDECFDCFCISLLCGIPITLIMILWVWFVFL